VIYPSEQYFRFSPLLATTFVHVFASRVIAFQHLIPIDAVRFRTAEKKHLSSSRIGCQKSGTGSIDHSYTITERQLAQKLTN
jgi:hypothetical protein